MSNSGKPDLVIQVRFDNDEAMRLLKMMQQQGKQTGDDTAKGMEGASKAAKQLGSELLSIIGVQSGFAAIGQAVSAVKDGMKEAAEYTRRVAKDYADIQEAIRIVATFKGTTPTDKFTVEQVKAGAEAGLSPQAWMDFQKQFQGFASQFTGKDGKISEAQSAELERRAASFMSAKGIEASQGGAIFGEILQQAKGGESVDDLMKLFGQSYSALEAAKGDPGPLLGQMGQVTAEGVDVLTGSKIMRAMAQRDPGEAGTYSRALLRGLRGVRMEGKSDELGIQENMDVFQQIEAVRKTMEGSGEKGTDFLARYFKDQREYDAMSAAINFGSKGGLFGMVDKSAAAVTGKTDIEAVDTFKNGTLGRRMYERAAKQAAEAETGQRFSGVEQARLQAERELTEEVDEYGRNRFQRVEAGDLMRATVGTALGYGSVHDQVVQQRARQDLEANLTPAQVSQAKAETPTLDGNVYLKRLVELAEERRSQPLSAPPPRTTERP